MNRPSILLAALASIKRMVENQPGDRNKDICIIIEEVAKEWRIEDTPNRS